MKSFPVGAVESTALGTSSHGTYGSDDDVDRSSALSRSTPDRGLGCSSLDGGQDNHGVVFMIVVIIITGDKGWLVVWGLSVVIVMLGVYITQSWGRRDYKERGCGPGNGSSGSPMFCNSFIRSDVRRKCLYGGACLQGFPCRPRRPQAS